MENRWTRNLDAIRFRKAIDWEGIPLKTKRYIRVRYRQRPSKIRDVQVFTTQEGLREVEHQRSEKADEPKYDVDVVDLSRKAKNVVNYSFPASDLGVISDIAPTARFKKVLQDKVHGLVQIRSKGLCDIYESEKIDLSPVYKGVIEFLYSDMNKIRVRNAIFTGLVAEFDSILADTARLILKKNPEIIAEFKRSVDYKDISTAEDFEAMKHLVVEDVIEELLFKSRIYQIEWIEKATGAPIKQNLKSWPVFIEACERRNAYVHNGSRVSQHYLNRISKATGSTPSYQYGSILTHDHDYFLKAVDAFFEAAVVITQSVCRFISSSDSETKIELDNHLSRYVYDQVDRDRQNSALNIAQLSIGGVFSPIDKYKKMIVVNAAVAEKSRGKKKRAEKLIDDVDWSSSLPAFALAIAGIKDDLDQTCELIEKTKGAELVTSATFFEWPAFDILRKEPRFWETVHRVYGDEIGVLDNLPVEKDDGEPA